MEKRWNGKEYCYDDIIKFEIEYSNGKRKKND